MLVTPHLRYLDVLRLRDGRYRLYYETSDDFGGHELRTELRGRVG